VQLPAATRGYGACGLERLRQGGVHSHSRVPLQPEPRPRPRRFRFSAVTVPCLCGSPLRRERWTVRTIRSHGSLRSSSLAVILQTSGRPVFLQFPSSLRRPLPLLSVLRLPRASFEAGSIDGRGFYMLVICHQCIFSDGLFRSSQYRREGGGVLPLLHGLEGIVCRIGKCPEQ
jgi:hypothetical protein